MKRTYVTLEIEKAKRHLLLAGEGLAALTLKLQEEPRKAAATAEVTPEKRECPACGRSIMAAATICGYCWKKVALPVPPVGIAPVAS